MTYPTLRAAKSETGHRNPDPHHYIKLVGGRWSRTLGPPSGPCPITGHARPHRLVHVRGNVWRHEV